MTYPRLTAVLLLAMGIPLTSQVWVLEASAQAQQQSPAARPSFDDSQLEAFANATVEVRRISQSYQSKIQSAQGDQDLEALRRQQMDELISAVKATGLSVDEYNQIHAVSRSSPEIAETINGYIEQIE
jgi:hypothetical protein